MTSINDCMQERHWPASRAPMLRVVLSALWLFFAQATNVTSPSHSYVEGPRFLQRTGIANPLSVVMGASKSAMTSALSCVDVDGDGDMDCFVGRRSGVIEYYENLGFNVVTFTSPDGAARVNVVPDDKTFSLDQGPLKGIIKTSDTCPTGVKVSLPTGVCITTYMLYGGWGVYNNPDGWPAGLTCLHTTADGCSEGVRHCGGQVTLPEFCAYKLSTPLLNSSESTGKLVSPPNYIQRTGKQNPLYQAGVRSLEPANYIGCYRDDAERDLELWKDGHSYSYDVCYRACKDYPFFSLQDGQSAGGAQCFCGNSYGSPPRQYPRLAQDNCCQIKEGCSATGDPNYPSGGGWANAVYQNVRATRRPECVDIDGGAPDPCIFVAAVTPI